MARKNTWWDKRIEEERMARRGRRPVVPEERAPDPPAEEVPIPSDSSVTTFRMPGLTQEHINQILSTPQRRTYGRVYRASTEPIIYSTDWAVEFAEERPAHHCCRCEVQLESGGEFNINGDWYCRACGLANHPETMAIVDQAAQSVAVRPPDIDLDANGGPVYATFSSWAEYADNVEGSGDEVVRPQRIPADQLRVRLSAVTAQRRRRLVRGGQTRYIMSNPAGTTVDVSDYFDTEGVTMRGEDIIEDGKGIRRKYYHSRELDKNQEPQIDGYTGGLKEKLVEVDDAKVANLIASLTERGYHAPVIDLDLPCQLVPSSTPGHYHLYIEKEIPWNQYLKLLQVLRDCGIIEEGYYNVARLRKMTMVRPPGVYKKGAKPPTELPVGQLDQGDSDEVAALRAQLEEAKTELHVARQEIARLQHLKEMSWG